MEPAAVPTSQRQRTSGGNTIGGGGACIGDLPDALLSLIFEGVQYTDWCVCHLPLP